MDDDVPISFGDAVLTPDCWWAWDTAGAPDNFQLSCTDIDGIGTDGVVCYVNEGSNDWRCLGSIVVTETVQAEQLTSTDDADVNDSLTCGDLVIDEAAGTISFTGVTSSGITIASNHLDLPKLDLQANDIMNAADIYVEAPAADAAPRAMSIQSQPVFAGPGAANTTGSNLLVNGTPGAINITGVTKAGTAGDTVAFFYVEDDGTTATVTLTEGVSYVCAAAASDAACVCNLKAAIDGHATLGALLVTAATDGTCSDEKLFIGINPATASWAVVTPSDNTNTVRVAGTDGRTIWTNPTSYLAPTGSPWQLTIGGYVTNFVGYAIGIDSGNAAWGMSGRNVSLTTTNRATTLSTGDISITSGNQTNAGAYGSGGINLTTGNTTTAGATGDITLTTGTAGAGAADAGDINLKTHTSTLGMQILGATGCVDTLRITQGDLTASCTLGQIALDTAGTAELCVCQATNTWYCIAVTDTTGPAD